MEESGIPGTADTAATPAIVVRSMFEKNEQAIADYLKGRGVKVKTRTDSQVSSEAGFNSGYEVGDKISLQKQVQPPEDMKQLNECL